MLSAASALIRNSIALSFVLVAAPSFALPNDVRVEREGDKVTYQSGKSSFVGDGAASDEIRTFVLKGVYDELPDLTCDELFEAFHSKILYGLPTEQAEYFGMTMCSFERVDGPARSFVYAYMFEPKSVDAIPALDAYRALHEGRDLGGTVLHYQRAFGVLIEPTVEFFRRQSEGDDGELLYRRTMRQMVLNRQQIYKWAENGAQAFEAPELDTFLAWLAGEAGGDTVWYLREKILAKTNYIYGYVGETVILEDRSLVQSPFALVIGERDCSQSPSGYCL